MKKKSPGNKRITSSNNHSFPIVVVGASAGGFNAILQLVSHLPSRSTASLFIVQHTSVSSNVSFLVQHLQQNTRLKCRIALHGETIKAGTVYFAVPGVHLVLSENKMIYGTGPAENNFKPSIDVLFRSAAVEFRDRTIGVVLSGLLEDGVAGMTAILKCGGTCIIQDPAEAEYPDMPLAVIKNITPHYIASAFEIGGLIRDAEKKPAKKIEVPEEIMQEAKIAQKVLTDIDDTRPLGKQSLFTCPDCGGTLWHIHDDVQSRYRCFTGHAYTEKGLLSKQTEGVQTTLWVALRLLEERKKLLTKVSSHSRINNRSKLDEVEAHIDRLKKLMGDIQLLTKESIEVN
jgi:two-component system chemotaxis response regulator CheB